MCLCQGIHGNESREESAKNWRLECTSDGSCNGDFDSAEILEGVNDSGDCEKRMV